MCSWTRCTACSLGCVGRLLGLLLGVRGSPRVSLYSSSPSSGWPSFSLAWAALPEVPVAASCCLEPVASALPRSTTSSWLSSSAVAASLALGCDSLFASPALSPLRCLALVSGLLLAVRFFAPWLAGAGGLVLAFIFRRMRRALARSLLISCGNRIM